MIARRWPWLVLPALGVLWAALHLRRTWFFYDEWSMIRRVLHSPAWAGMMAPFNGHLWMLQYWLYRAQVTSTALSLAASLAAAAIALRTPPSAMRGAIVTMLMLDAGGRVAQLLAPVLAVVAFLLGIPPLRAYETTFDQWNADTRRGVAVAVSVIRDGCPSGNAPNPDTQPLDDLGPQITTRVLRELIDRDALDATVTVPPDDAIVARMCQR